jgi:hypothetical protein
VKRLLERRLVGAERTPQRGRLRQRSERVGEPGEVPVDGRRLAPEGIEASGVEIGGDEIRVERRQEPVRP